MNAKHRTPIYRDDPGVTWPGWARRGIAVVTAAVLIVAVASGMYLVAAVAPAVGVVAYAVVATLWPTPLDDEDGADHG